MSHIVSSFSKRRFTQAVIFPTFRYPLAGRIVVRQPRDDWTADTVILVEQLVHADGTTLKSSQEHRWGVSVEPPGKDFYDWQNRCVSAGLFYDGFLVSTAFHHIYVYRCFQYSFIHLGQHRI